MLIDFGAFNVRLANKIRPLGPPLLYYFPPGSWKKKGTVHSNLAQLTDRIATPFPWSEERLRSVGLVEPVGDPTVEPVVAQERVMAQEPVMTPEAVAALNPS